MRLRSSGARIHGQLQAGGPCALVPLGCSGARIHGQLQALARIGRVLNRCSGARIHGQLQGQLQGEETMRWSSKQKRTAGW